MSDYLTRLQDAQRAGVFQPGEVAQVDVEHGPGCRHQPCTCHPRITAVIGDEVLTIGTGGAVLERRRRA